MRRGGRLAALLLACAVLVGIVSQTAATRQQAGVVTFRDNYELGHIDTSQWTVQCQPWLGESHRGILRVVTSPVHLAPRAARIDLPPHERNSVCELLRARKLGLGTDDYYSFAWRFPKDWRRPSEAFWGVVLAQLNYQLIWGAPIGLSAHRDRLVLTAQTGYCDDVDSARPGCTHTNGSGGIVRGAMRCQPSCQVIRRGELTLGVWHELVVHVRWRADSSGLIEAWHRTRKSPWIKRVSIVGYPTVQWSTARPLAGWEADAWETTDKLGAFRGASGSPLTLWNDGFCVATSFAAAASCLG